MAIQRHDVIDRDLERCLAFALVLVHPGQQLGVSLAPFGVCLFPLGFRAGKPLQVMRRGTLSGPLHVRLGTTDVILRRSEAAEIEVRPAPDGYDK